VAKYYTARQATDDNMAHAHCMLDTYSYKHILRICNTYCFSTATLVARKQISGTSVFKGLCIFLQDIMSD